MAGFTRITASAGHQYYPALVKGYNSGRMNAAVLSITKKSLDRAANGLADLIVSIKKKIPGK